MRVRKVVTRSGKRFRVKFPSRKMNQMVQRESLLERDAILHFECHPLVVTYQAKSSIEIYYDREAICHKYFPDFRLDFSDKLQAVAKRTARVTPLYIGPMNLAGSQGPQASWKRP